ncbi:MAG: GNAT family N-acetyltransferase [Pseudomonadota bacterium]
MIEREIKGKTIRFRPKVAGDTAALHHAWAEAVKATHHFLSEADFDAISIEVLRDYIPSAELLVAEYGSVVFGFMGMTDLEIDALFIRPDWFGQGIGRAFISLAAERGAPLTVEVNEDNPGAVSFYKTVGFEIVARSDTDNQGRPFPLLKLQEGPNLR